MSKKQMHRTTTEEWEEDYESEKPKKKTSFMNGLFD